MPGKRSFEGGGKAGEFRSAKRKVTVLKEGLLDKGDTELGVCKRKKQLLRRVDLQKMDFLVRKVE